MLHWREISQISPKRQPSLTLSHSILTVGILSHWLLLLCSASLPSASRLSRLWQMRVW